MTDTDTPATQDEREALISDLFAVEGILGLSHYRGERITRDQIALSVRALEKARKLLAEPHPTPSVDDVAKALREHALDEAYGGTASVANCECSCGFVASVPGGLRDHAEWLAQRHVATAAIALFGGEG